MTNYPKNLIDPALDTSGKISITVAGLVYKFDDWAAFGRFLETLARQATNEALSARTQKDARFKEGKAFAYRHVAEFFKDITHS